MLWIGLLAFVAFMTVVILIYLAPGDQTNSGKKLKEKQHKKAAEQKAKQTMVADPVKPSSSDKDWKVIAERWEKNNGQLNQEIEKLKVAERRFEKEKETLLAKQKDLNDKLELEKSWRDKEQVNIDKFKQNEKGSKEQLMRAENDLEKEHSNRLRIERDAQELKIKYDALMEEKRQLAVKVASQDTLIESTQKQNKELKAENAKLKEKREDVQWVAKTEFDELQKRFQHVSKELEKLKAT